MNIKKIIFYLFLFSILIPGTDGTVRGRVLNMKGEPLPGAQVFIQELGIGTIADIEGNYFLLNVNVGKYDVTVAMIGYATQEVTGVDVIMDQTVWLNFSMKVEAVEGEKIVVSGERALVEKGSTSKKITVSKEAIEALPVRDMADLFSLQSGVVKVEGGMQGGIPDHEEKGLEEVHVRGGRTGEIAYMIDGLYIRNPIFGGIGSSTRLNLFAIKHWDWQPGGFNAEYGDAMSAVSNSHTNKGSRKKFEYKFQYSTSLVGAALGSRYDELRGFNDYSMGFGGPLPIVNGLFDDSFLNMTYWISGQSTSKDNRSVYEFDDNYYIPNNLGNDDNRTMIVRTNSDGLQDTVGVQPWDNVGGFRGFGYENTDDIFANLSLNLFNNKLRLNTTFWKVKAKQKIFSQRFLYWDEGQNELFRDTDRWTFELNHSLSQKTFYTVRLSRFQQASFNGVRWRDSDQDGYPDWFEWSNPAGERQNPSGTANRISDPYNPDVVPYTYNDDKSKVYYPKRDGLGPEQWTSGWYYGAPVPGNYKWDTAEEFEDANLNGIWDEGEQFEDLDQDGTWDGPALVQACEYRDGSYWLTPEMYVDYTDFLDQEVYWNEVMQNPATEHHGYIFDTDSLYFLDYNFFAGKWSEGSAFGGHDRYYSTSNALTQEVRFDITSQLTDKWKARAGVDYKTHKLDFIEVVNPWDDVSAARQIFSEQWDDFGADGVEYIDSDSGLPDEGEGNGQWDPGESYDDFNRDGQWNSYVEPTEFSAYIQNTFEVPWMVINAGIRADAVNFNTKIWSEPEFFSDGDRIAGEFSPERPWFWSDCGLDGLCPGELYYDSPWNEGGGDYGTFELEDGIWVKTSDVLDGIGDADVGEGDKVYDINGNGYWNYGEFYQDELDGICGDGDDYIDFNNNGICDEENGDTFLNDLAGNKQWDWDDANGNGVCDDGECEYFEDEGEEASTVFGMENEEVFFRNSEWFWKFSPRIGFSHVINDEATFTFNYGVYYQTPTYDNVYLNTNRQEDPAELFEESVGEIGNATMTAARSQAYECAFNFQIGPQWGVTVGAWLKDMDQMATAKTYRSGIYEYQVSSNGDYGTAKGIDLTVRNSGMLFTTVLQYTYSIAKANGDYDKAAFGGVYVDAPSQTYLMPFDRPHDLTLSLYTALPFGIMTSLTGFYQSGIPYTPQEMVGDKPYTDQLKKNTRRSDAYRNVNMSFSKYLDYKDFKITLGLNVFNIMDWREPYGVWPLTGKPDEPGEYYMKDVINQNNGGTLSGSFYDMPWRYSSPREINFFVRFDFN